MCVLRHPRGLQMWIAYLSLSHQALSGVKNYLKCSPFYQQSAEHYSVTTTSSSSTSIPLQIQEWMQVLGEGKFSSLFTADLRRYYNTNHIGVKEWITSTLTWMLRRAKKSLIQISWFFNMCKRCVKITMGRGWNR